MTHCSLVSLVRLVQEHLALVPLKPSSGPPSPPTPLPLCVQLSFTSTLPQRQRVTTKFHPGAWLQFMLANALFYKLPCKTKTYKDFNYFTFSSPHFVYCPPNPGPSSFVGQNIQSYQGSTHPLYSGPWQYSKGNIQYSKGNIQSFQGSTHPLCSGPWPSCCRPRFAQRQSCPDGRSV